MRHELSESRWIKRGYPFRNLIDPEIKEGSAHYKASDTPKFAFEGYDSSNWRWRSDLKTRNDINAWLDSIEDSYRY